MIKKAFQNGIGNVISHDTKKKDLLKLDVKKRKKSVFFQSKIVGLE
jgi:hypothetical protein